MENRMLSDLYCPECGEKNLVADFEHNGSDAIINTDEERVIYPEGCDIGAPVFRIFRCENCDFESYVIDEIMEKNK